MTTEKVLKDIRADCQCQNNEYCPLEVLVRANERVCEQHKVIEVYRWQKNKTRDTKMTWEEAYDSFSSEGYAKKFAEVYQEGMLHYELATKTLGDLLK
jgi:hypothetical protein